jgi:putative membrane protein
MLLIIFKGMLIGVANLVPGVSGGTMAFVLGIYGKLIEALGGLVLDRAKRKAHFIFLLLVFAGAALGILIFARIFHVLLATPLLAQPTYFFFAGLIIGFLPFFLKIHHDMKLTAKRLATLLIGMFLLILFSLIGDQAEITQFPEAGSGALDAFKVASINWPYGLWLLFCGFITAGSMIVPGFSGAALLISLGEYQNILYFVNEILLVPLTFFVVGALPGIFIFARIVSYLLKNHPASTFYFILGLVLASLYQLGLEIAAVLNLTAPNLLAGLMALIAGFYVAYLLNRIRHIEDPPTTRR